MKQDLRETLPKVRNPLSFTLRKEKQRKLRETGPRKQNIDFFMYVKRFSLSVYAQLKIRKTVSSL